MKSINFPLILLAVLITLVIDNLYSANPVEYKVNTKESKIEWVGTKPGGQHNGTVGLSDGYLTIKKGQLAGGAFTIDLKSIVDLDLESAEWNQKLVGHLKSEDFFYVEKYPTGTFTITQVQKKTGNNYTITGNLNLHGVTKSLSFDAQVNIEGSKITGTTLPFVLDRTAWNIKTMSKNFFADLKDAYIDDTMQIKIYLVAGN